MVEKVSFCNVVIFALVLAEVTSWTIDLPEVRKFYFEKNARDGDKHNDNESKNEENKRTIIYNNIDGNSKHNVEHYDDVYENSPYAREYGYQSYMERKVNDIVYNGSVYLEGLRRSLEDYSKFLESCNRMMKNNTTNNETIPKSSTTWRPAIESTNSTESMGQNSTRRCQEVTKTSEHVRRLSALAMWATRELQDTAYARKYNKGDLHDLSMEENELILKLAWFLDRLAHYTGYEPEPKHFLQDEEKTTTTTTTPVPMMMNPPPSEEVMRQMMNCMKQKSSEPAVDRCRYPEPLPPMVQMMMEMNSNITGVPVPSSVSATNQYEQILPMYRQPRSGPVSEQSMELLIASDNRTPISNYPPIFAAIKSVQKRSLSMLRPEASKSKQSIDDPAINFLKYYAKHKIWMGANMKNVDKSFQEYEVKNSLVSHKIEKRDLYKKYKHLRVPVDPFQDLSKYVKHKPGVNYVKDEKQAEKIKEAVEKMKIKPNSKHLFRLAKMLRQKRSIEYEKDVDLPRESENPQGDISFYIKNKPGRIYNNNLRQAVQLRGGLQQVFETGNIEVVRRYGSNFNPLNPNPFMAGLLRSAADF